MTTICEVIDSLVIVIAIPFVEEKSWWITGWYPLQFMFMPSPDIMKTHTLMDCQTHPPIQITIHCCDYYCYYYWNCLLMTCYCCYCYLKPKNANATRTGSTMIRMLPKIVNGLNSLLMIYRYVIGKKYLLLLL